MTDEAEEAREAKRHITFSVPDDPVLLAAFGEVSILHGHVDYMLKMFIKNLTGMTLQGTRGYTARWSSKRLREKVLKLATKLPAEDASDLSALIDRCEDLSEKRNSLIHGLIGKEGDGEHVMASDIGRFAPLPSTAEINTWAHDLENLRSEMVGFLTMVIWRLGR
jgi:hypothetical protein